MKDFSIRPATMDDLDRVVEMAKAASASAWSRSGFAAEIEKKFSHFWVLTDDESDETLLGFCLFHFPDTQAHLLEIVVDERLRRQGVGAHLLRSVISFVMRNDGESVFLEVRKSNLPAINFYQSLGFVITHSLNGFYSDGEAAYKMCFTLKPSIAAVGADDLDA